MNAGRVPAIDPPDTDTSTAITVWEERDLGGTFAAILLVVEDAVAIMVDPKVTRAVPVGILRAWAFRQVAVGWHFALLTASDVAKLTG